MTNFEQLPNETLIKIFDNDSISAEDFNSIAKVCRRFNNICTYEKLAKSKFIKRWPWVWKKITSENINTLNVENWVKEIEAAFVITKKLEVEIHSLSQKLNKYTNIPSSNLSSIFDLFHFGSFGTYIVLNELREIVRKEREINSRNISGKGYTMYYENMYYARNILRDVTCYLCSQDLERVMKLPFCSQSVEKVAFYFSKIFQPKEYLYIEYDEISSKLDKLANEVQSLLKTMRPDHPAASIQLFSPEEPLEEDSQLMSEDECLLFCECINDILLNKRKYRTFRNPKIEDNFLKKVLETGKGTDLTISIIRIAIAHRLGILLHLCYYNDRYSLKWKRFSSENSRVINVGSHYVISPDRMFDKCKNYSPIKRFLGHLAIDSWVITMTNKKHEPFHPDNITAARVILLFESNFEGCLVFAFSEEFSLINYCLKHGLHLEVVIEICQKLLKTGTDMDEKEEIRCISTKAEDLLDIQLTAP